MDGGTYVQKHITVCIGAHAKVHTHRSHMHREHMCRVTCIGYTSTGAHAEKHMLRCTCIEAQAWVQKHAIGARAQETHI